LGRRGRGEEAKHTQIKGLAEKTGNRVKKQS
jgi:hypothetical protein